MKKKNCLISVAVVHQYWSRSAEIMKGNDTTAMIVDNLGPTGKSRMQRPPGYWTSDVWKSNMIFSIRSDFRNPYGSLPMIHFEGTIIGKRAQSTLFLLRLR